MIVVLQTCVLSSLSVHRNVVNVVTFGILSLCDSLIAFFLMFLVASHHELLCTQVVFFFGSVWDIS